mgnify:CR=1 FL=1
MTDRTLPYGQKTDPAKRHPAALPDGPDRARAGPMPNAARLHDANTTQPATGAADGHVSERGGVGEGVGCVGWGKLGLQVRSKQHKE